VKNKYCFLDFEYNQTKEKHLNVICCVTLVDGVFKKWWIPIYEFRLYVLRLQEEGYIFLSWNVVAEASAFYSLGLDPTKFQWIDLYLEYRCLLNGCNRLSYGKQLSKEGKEVTTFPPDLARMYETEADDSVSSSKPSYSLGSAVYKLLGKRIDLAEKETIRDIIIRGIDVEIHREEILKYCEHDVTNLPLLFKAILAEYRQRLKDDAWKLLKGEMLARGDYAARTAIMERDGYPVNVEWMKNFTSSVKPLLSEVAREINQHHPMRPFKWDKKEQKFKQDQNKLKEWIGTLGLEWPMTEKRGYSLKQENFEKFFPFRHNYPTDNLGAQILRYLNIKQSLNGFVPTKEGKTIWDSVGTDGRVRPYMNIYGSQTARSQPSSTSFIPLKSAWMRSLIYPELGTFILGADYKSEEFLIAGLLSGDQAMIDAYHSGDVYLWFAKEAGAVPKDGKKEGYKEIRDLFKSTVLGMSFGMRAKSLALKLTSDTGKLVTEEEAQKLIDDFESIFHVYTEWKEDVVFQYETDGYLKLSDGWYMWGDNENNLSVKNFLVQGMGSVIMREAVKLCQMAGLQVIFTLHDALYIQGTNLVFQAPIFADCMLRAFYNVFGESKDATVGLDLYAWSESLFSKEEKITTCGWDIDVMPILVDERDENEYKKYSKYFMPDDLAI